MVLVSITGYTFAALNRHGQSADPNTKRKLPTIRIQRLIGLQPKTARVIRDNKEIDIAISMIKNAK